MKGGDWRSGGCGSVVLFLGGLELEEIHSSGGLRIGSEMLLDLLGSSNPTIYLASICVLLYLHQAKEI